MNRILINKIENYLLSNLFQLNELNDYMENKGFKRDIKEENGMYFIYKNDKIQMLIDFTFIPYMGSLKELYEINEITTWLL